MPDEAVERAAEALVWIQRKRLWPSIPALQQETAIKDAQAALSAVNYEEMRQVVEAARDAADYRPCGTVGWCNCAICRLNSALAALKEAQ